MESLALVAAKYGAKYLLKLVTDVVKNSKECPGACKKLQNTLEGMIPLLEPLNTGVELPEQNQKVLNDLRLKLQKGIELFQNGSKLSSLQIFERSKYTKKIEDLNSDIIHFTQTQGWALLISEVRLRGVNMEDKLEGGLQNIEHKMEDGFQNLMHEMVEMRNFGQGLMDLSGIDNLASELSVPELNVPKLQGLGTLFSQVKESLLEKDVSLLGVTGMGGIGKTTLTKALCNDPKVKGYFNKIVYAPVSKNPDIQKLLIRMWQTIVPGGRNDEFNNIEDVRIQLQKKIRDKKTGSVLVVLDDVWEKHHLRDLWFKGKGCKTLITSRIKNIIDKPYELPCLRKPDDVSLFCLSAFDQDSIPKTEDEELVNEVIEECKGLPLALNVIGKYLYDKLPEEWTAVKKKLSQGQPIDEDHKALLECLATSIDNVEEEVRECFLDMAIFPEARKSCVDPLLDLGVYVHDLDWESAYAILVELASRNLVNLVDKPKRTRKSYQSSRGLSFTQHDVLRDMCIHRNRENPKINEPQRLNELKRLIMPQRADAIPKDWKKAAECAFAAEIVSLDTGLMKEKDWCQMKFPKAKALILNFSASEYFLPPFMESMPELKVLIIVNHHFQRATLKGISVFSSLTQLKVVRLERVKVPPLQEYRQSWQKLEKLSFTLCEGFGDVGLDWYFPSLVEFAIDHCSGLKELPASVCNMASLERLFVTNCPDLLKLPDDIGNLSLLQMLRLYACPILEKLPCSICNLRRLLFLDISLCGHIKQLPDELGRLSSLEEIHMRDCSGVNIPKSASDLKSLKRVICHEKIEKRWKKINPGLLVESAEEEFGLSWLD